MSKIKVDTIETLDGSKSFNVADLSDATYPIEDVLTSTNTNSALSANQGRVLKGLVDGKSATSHTHGNATTSSAGFFSASDKTKLDGVATGATANSSDATLKDRANHTGTQAISTVSGLQAALDAKAPLTAISITDSLPAIRPSLLLDFANSKQVDPRIAVTRASPATRTNDKGLIETVAANVPRIDFDPATGECKGLLIEEARTNLLLNSLIDGTNLSTQTVTVAAVAHTVSFYGPGSVSLSGAHSATVNGSAPYPARTFLTFTPSAGSLVLTVTGDVKFAQLEAGSFPTSFIPTPSSAATRAADVASMSGTNFSEWFNPLEGTFVFTGSIAAIDMAAIQEHYLLSVSNGNAANCIALRGFSGTGVNAGAIRVDARCVTASVDQADTAEVVVAVNSTFTAAVALKSNDLASSTNASTPSTDTSVTLPSVNTLYIGAAPTAAPKNAHIKRISYYQKRLTNAELQALTA